jgi:DNA (cytosine-5)-methyltransferase 1
MSVLDVDLTDMFCGAGGSSTGATQVPGVTVRTAMNHWKPAIDSHNANHPTTDHILADVSQTDPRYVARTTMLWGSPECTNHSVAKGKKRATGQGALFGDGVPDEAADRSRATMWDMVRFAEHHRYEVMFTENVVDAYRWLFFDQWLACFDKLGYDHHIVFLNSMHAQLAGLPAPQSRDRMYVVFWKKGNRAPDFDRLRPVAYCPSCDELVRAIQVFKKPERWGRYRAQYNYRCPKTSCRNGIVEPAWLPAATAIDWTLEGERIGDRAKPLAPKTMARIEAGLAKYGAEPLSIDSVRGSQIIVPVGRDPFATQTTAYTRSLLVPVEGRDGKTAQSVNDAMRTQTTRNETGLLVPAGASLLMEYYGNGVMHRTTKPIPTITTHDRFAMITLRGQNAPKSVGDVMDTFAANGQHHGLMGVNPPAVEDCTFRMLEPREITAGMAFPKDYIMLGNKRTQVKLAGNAVTPPCARDLITIGAESLEAS